MSKYREGFPNSNSRERLPYEVVRSSTLEFLEQRLTVFRRYLSTGQNPKSGSASGSPGGGSGGFEKIQIAHPHAAPLHQNIGRSPRNVFLTYFLR